MTVEIKTWYDLKRFIVDELDGEQLGQPVRVSDDWEGTEKEVHSIERNGDSLMLIVP